MPKNSIEKQFKKICDENSEYKELYATWNLDKESISQILSNVIKDYPYYSLHDVSHAQNVLSNIEKLLGDKGIEILSPTDMWLILHAAYFHDSGMVIKDTNIYELWRSEEFKAFLDECTHDTDKSIQEAAKLLSKFNPEKESSYEWALNIKKAVILINSRYFRSHHGEISESYVSHSDIWGIDLGHNGIIQSRLVKLVGAISALHTGKFEDVIKLHKTSNGFKTDYVHPRFVACLLRLGDLLDLDNGRFNPFISGIYGDVPETSLVHKGKHESTTHVLITPKEIEVEADCNSDEVYRETVSWFNMLKDEVEKLQLNWNDIAPDEFERAPKLIEPRVLRDGKVDKWGFANLKMEISQSKALELIQGSSFYKDKFTCLREIIQNAEDASKIQLWRDILEGRYYCDGGIDREKVESGTLMPYDIKPWIYDIYTIKVMLENKGDHAVVKVVDRGIGISPEKLKRMCNVGSSYHALKIEREEIESMPNWLRPTGSFGIGLQSCFLLTDSFTIETKADGEQAMHITFVPPSENRHPIVKNIENLQRGTTVKLEVSNENNYSFGLGGYAYNQLSHVDPFKSKAIVIYKIVESILEKCYKSLFKIALKSNTLNLNEVIDNTNNGEADNWQINGDIHWHFSEDHKRIVCWYNSNLYNILLCDSIGLRRCDIFFKGKMVENGRSIIRSLPGVRVILDIYGRKTENTLKINRDELEPQVVEEIVCDIEKIVKFYFEVVYSNRDNLNDTYQFCNYVLCARMYNTNLNIDDIKRKVNKSNDSTFSVLKKNSNGKFVKTDMHFSNMIEAYPYLSYIDEIVVNKLNKNMYPEAIETHTLCDCLNNGSANINAEYIIIDSKLIDILKRKNNTVQYIPCEGRHDICIYTVIEDDFFIKDGYTREKMIDRLIYNNSLPVKQNIYKHRVCIPAIEGYAKIAVKKPEILLGYIEIASCYIISPLTLDFKDLHNSMNEEAYIDYVTKTSEFKNLVEYVQEYSVQHSDKDVIIADYKKLISEYYRHMHKSNENAE